MPEKLLDEANEAGIQIRYHDFKNQGLKGLYVDGVITLNPKAIENSAEKRCVIAEETGHYYTSVGNILDQTDVGSRKQEKRARNWGYERLIPLPDIVQAHKTGIRNRFELAEYFGVTEDFLGEAFKHYQEKYGLLVAIDAQHTICFDPLGVIELIEL
ncbi:MAG: ImmA/IrrE family metallo-endopeptidase [Gorillibacterium sp.]|nr:ImmA/IrrE family metallo-endopeptidase [Gorillibacterium sp.]